MSEAAATVKDFVVALVLLAIVIPVTAFSATLAVGFACDVREWINRKPTPPPEQYAHFELPPLSPVVPGKP